MGELMPGAGGAEQRLSRVPKDGRAGRFRHVALPSSPEPAAQCPSQRVQGTTRSGYVRPSYRRLPTPRLKAGHRQLSAT